MFPCQNGVLTKEQPKGEGVQLVLLLPKRKRISDNASVPFGYDSPQMNS